MTQGPAIRNRGSVPPTETSLLILMLFAFFEAMLITCSNKRYKQRMRLERLGLEFGVELASQEPGMVFDFDDLDQLVLRIPPGKEQPGPGQVAFVGRVEFIAVAMPLLYISFPIGFIGTGL